MAKMDYFYSEEQKRVIRGTWEWRFKWEPFEPYITNYVNGHEYTECKLSGGRGSNWDDATLVASGEESDMKVEQIESKY